MWRILLRVVKAVGLLAGWVIALVLGLVWFLHGIRGYRKCPGVEPGESCAFTSARGTIRVAYEDLEQVDIFSLVLGSVTLLVVAGWAALAIAAQVESWRERHPRTTYLGG